MAVIAQSRPRRKKRAIALAGGGPAAGFHIGALQALEAHGITFDVWSLSCIGAWVGTYYNQLPDECDDKAAQTYEFFKANAFRDTDSYRGFPVNKAFAPNLAAYGRAWTAHLLDPQTYVNAFSIGNELGEVATRWDKFFKTPAMWWREGDRNAHLLNNVLAVHPVSRFMTLMAYLSGINGLANIYYKDSTFLDDFKISKLDLVDEPELDLMSGQQLRALADRIRSDELPAERRAKPEIYHNAYRLTHEPPGAADKMNPFDSGSPPTSGKLRLFNNKWFDYWKRGNRDYLPITRPSLCACSA